MEAKTSVAMGRRARIRWRYLPHRRSTIREVLVRTGDMLVPPGEEGEPGRNLRYGIYV